MEKAKKLVFTQIFGEKKKKKIPPDKEKLKSVAHASKKSKFVPPVGYENPKLRN